MGRIRKFWKVGVKLPNSRINSGGDADGKMRQNGVVSPGVATLVESHSTPIEDMEGSFTLTAMGTFVVGCVAPSGEVVTGGKCESSGFGSKGSESGWKVKNEVTIR